MNRFIAIVLTILGLFPFPGCTEEAPDSQTDLKEENLFTLLTTESTNISFNNRIEENEKFNMVDYFYVYNGGGVAIGDIDNDGLPDIYFTGNMVNDRLYLNKGGLKFMDISESAGINIPGWSTGVTMVDINYDGLLDIYVSRSGNYPSGKRKNLLYINNGDLTFSEEAEKFGIADTGYSTQATFFDYDKDGDLDMYLLNHTNEIKDPNNVRPLINDGSGLANDRLYRNDRNKKKEILFTDVTQQAGILYDGFGLGVGVADINGDGWEDIFVTNDFLANDYLYINNKDGTFKESAKTYLDHVSHFSMGNDLADINNDGLIDAVTLDMLPKDNYHKKKMSGPLNNDLFKYSLQMGYAPQYMRNTLQLNRGTVKDSDLSFSEIGQLAGIEATDWSWGPLFADFDNDGWKDLFIANGYLRDITDLDFINYTASLSANDSLDVILKQKAKEMPSIKLSNFLFRNSKDLIFTNMTEQWGIDRQSLSNGAAYSDLDRDGDLDIVTNNINESAFVYENLSESFPYKNFLSIRLKGDKFNPDAVGAYVIVFQNSQIQVLHQSLTRGYQSSIEPLLHFGLGSNDKIDSIGVRWPDGTATIHKGKTAPNKMLTIDKKSGTPSSGKLLNQTSTALFEEVTDTYNLAHTHQDPDYDDFKRQFLLPHKHSRQAPGIAIGDIDNDGRDDFFIGGGYNSPGYIFYQEANGNFIKKPLTQKNIEKFEEDTGVLLFDYDNDGDQDLYVVSGSSEFKEGSEYYQDRLYENKGKGGFILNQDALPKLRNSGSCVKAADFDQDGDLDLFLGGRIRPLKYPMPPESQILVNQNGKFTDQTNQIAPDLQRIGMVTDALWTDYDNDLDMDLIIVGEFMPIQFMENNGGKLSNASTKAGLNHTSGWWNSINSGDFDNDGDLDYVLGNLGLNTKYKVSKDEPLTLYAADYDKNGFIDPIMTYYVDHVEYPTHPRDELIRQIPSMKKKFPDYTSYAKATIADILSSSDKSSSYISKAFRFSSGYLENIGKGRFKLHDLPLEAQLAPVYGLIVEDFDMDGSLDVLLGGNDRGTEVGTGSYDALKGLLLKGDGDGNFKPVSLWGTGVFLEGDIRGTATIKINGQMVYLFGQNSGPLKAYTTRGKKYEVFDVPKETVKAKIIFSDGKEQLKEFYFGSSYLSQSKRHLKLGHGVERVILYDSDGKETIMDRSIKQ